VIAARHVLLRSGGVIYRGRITQSCLLIQRSQPTSHGRFPAKPLFAKLPRLRRRSIRSLTPLWHPDRLAQGWALAPPRQDGAADRTGTALRQRRFGPFGACQLGSLTRACPLTADATLGSDSGGRPSDFGALPVQAERHGETGSPFEEILMNLFDSRAAAGRGKAGAILP
jgi:hypothetical protein